MLRSSRQARASLFVVPTRAAFGQGRGTVAFRDVNLMPMTCQCILPHQVVVVSGGTIGRVGPLGEVAIPREARIIEGRGKTWLLPGLADMHVHTADAEELPLYLANAVTTILNLGDGAGQNVWESLCEGYQAIADTARAKLSCEKALELDPWNQDAQGVLVRLVGPSPPK